MPVSPTPGMAAMASIGEIDTAVTPMMIGRRMPNGRKPTVWIRVAMPQANKSALISIASWSFGRCRAPPIISGTATALAYMTSTCCKPSAKSFGSGKTSSTGWTGLLWEGLR
jgi:hypothetical protein